MPLSSRKSTAIIILVAVAFFMENLDGTVIATALPQMGESFHVSPVDLNIGMTAYLLMLAVFIPISGWVADRLGARTVFMSAIAIFTASSILCGLSGSMWEFTAARIIQGIGGAMMVPVGRLVVLRTTEKHNLMDAINYITWPGLVAPVVGPPLGGFITTYVSWHWIFFLNVPLGIIGIVLASVLIANLKGEKKKPFDWVGFALSSTASVTFMYGMELVGRQGAAWRTSALYLACGAVLGALSVIHFRRAPTPLLNLALLKIKTFGITMAGGSLFRISISVSPFLLPLMFQVAFGLNAFRSGLLLLALFAGNLIMKTVTTQVLRRFGFRRVLVVNGVLTSLMILACTQIFPQSPKILILAILFVNGLCRSMQFTSLSTLAFADIPKGELSTASSFFSMLTQMTMGMGVAVGAIALRLGAYVTGNTGSAPTTKEFHIAFMFVALLALVGTIDCFTLDRDAGVSVSGHGLAGSAEHSPAAT
ncbi:MAG TPA: MFS transporter [Candidatus Dormibacteraeota bacterium]|nr:MFS transporter [Candidatus Dormibacteraeota bacterium]